MLQHAKYTFQMVRHMPGPENLQIDYRGISPVPVNVGYIFWCLHTYFLG